MGKRLVPCRCTLLLRVLVIVAQLVNTYCLDWKWQDDEPFQGVEQLCHLQNAQSLNGEEGRGVEGMVLDKVYMVVASDRSLPVDGLPVAPINCHFHQQASLSSSNKVRTFTQIALDFKSMVKSKAGLNVFKIVPSAGPCGIDSVSPLALAWLVELGEFWATRYKSALPQINKPSEKAVLAGSLADQSAYQSVVAILHGLLNEKQLMGTSVKKVEHHKMRGLGSHCTCPELVDFDTFVQQAYRYQHELFKDSNTHHPSQQHIIYQEWLGLKTILPARSFVNFLSTWFCEAKARPCHQDKCLNVSEAFVSQLLQSVGEYSAYLSSVKIFQSYSVVDAQPYLKDVLTWLHDQNSQHVIKLDVTSDFFFLKLLTALGYHSQIAVVPVSRLVIEQYRERQSAGSASFIRLLLNGKVISQNLSVCSQSGGRGLCAMNTISQSLEEQQRQSLWSICLDNL